MALSMVSPFTYAGPNEQGIEAIKNGVGLGEDLRLTLDQGEPIVGSYEGFASEREMIRLKLYNSSSSRFSNALVPMADVTEITWLDRDADGRYPFVASMALAFVGSTVGFLAAERPRGRGDASSRGIPPGGVAIILGFIGLAAGAFLGALFAPVTTTEHVIWTR